MCVQFIGYALTTTSEKATVGLYFTFTCLTTETLVTFKIFTTNVCTITGSNTDGTCALDGSYNTDYIYTCNPTTDTYTVTILGYYLTDSLHETTWKYQDPFRGGVSNPKILYAKCELLFFLFLFLLRHVPSFWLSLI